MQKPQRNAVFTSTLLSINLRTFFIPALPFVLLVFTNSVRSGLQKLLAFSYRQKKVEKIKMPIYVGH